MNLTERLSRSFRNQLLSTPAGRAHVLNQLAEAEATGEGRLFEQVLSRVDDPHLQKVIKKHRDDEIRHAELFRERLAENGGTPAALQPELDYIGKLDAALGGLLGRRVRDAAGVMEAYLFLQVLEERAIVDFERLGAAFRSHDPETADVIAAIALDEERHLRYCRAISIRYAPDDRTLRETLKRFRDVESRVYRDQELANMRHALDRGLAGRGPEGFFWRAMNAFARLRRASPTPFAAELPAPLFA